MNKALAALRLLVRSSATFTRLAFAAAPGRASAAIGFELLGAIFALVSSYQIKGVVQAASNHAPDHAVAAALVLAATAGAASLCFMIYGQLSPRLVEAISVHLDAELVRLTARIPTIEYADRPVHADKIGLIRNSRQQLASGLQVVAVSFRMILTLLGTFVILIGVDPWLALLPLFAIPRAFAGREARRLQVQAQEATAEPMRLRGHIFNHATSPVAGKELRIFGLGEELADRYRQISMTTRHLNVRANWGGALWSALGDAIFTAGCIAAVAWLVVQAAHGAVTPAGVVLAASLITGLILQMNAALQYTQFIQALSTTAERYVWLEDFSNEAAKTELGDTPSPVILRRAIAVENVTFAYPDRDTPVLADISLEIPAGKVIALVGENGSGKSTLVKLLCGFYRPSSGRILIDETDLTDIAPADWRGRIDGAFQDFTNFETPMHESVGLGDLPRLGDRERAAAAMARAGGADLAKLNAQGLEVMLGKKWGGIDLSGGQWQKLALARALMRDDPLLVVFDEPAAALDASAEHDLFERFAAEARSGQSAGRATLLISHRFSTVRMADAIAVLEDGRIAEFGSHPALMAAGGRYAELFEIQASAYR
ncbi:MAG TPA: ABC transporter ATP-binding protein [Phenylobacterium sp.]|jgi:ABC-type multidrug transport system fused ATPase/permease subunit|uniref:ABC transporter ATP-binding protein n=1 Tax=Phenylobacterium sp. TaxID=1871053 RepID=UPI002D4568A6|nr:ABC transporter ATP-binding protein [Phenylobacterium sp.]HZZ68993.1 ABC transporter ATP-binding protein [Phenylobacterium sp.]